MAFKRDDDVLAQAILDTLDLLDADDSDERDAAIRVIRKRVQSVLDRGKKREKEDEDG